MSTDRKDDDELGAYQQILERDIKMRNLNTRKNRYVTSDLVETYIENRNKEVEPEKDGAFADMMARVLILGFMVLWIVLIVFLGN